MGGVDDERVVVYGRSVGIGEGREKGVCGDV